MPLTPWRALTVSLLCGVLAGCAAHSQSVAELIDAGKDAQALEIVRDSKGSPEGDPGYALAMTRAVQAGDAELVSALLDHGADPNLHSGPLQVTPLHSALHRSTTTIYVDAARVLLDRGADPKSVDSQGATPLDYLAARRVVYIQQAKEAGVRLLLERGADAAARDADGWTPLHYSAASGDSGGVLQLLLDHGASVSAADRAGLTPLDAAIAGGSEPGARYLFEHGAAPHVLLAGPSWPAHATEVHRQFAISGKGFALFGDWKRERGEPEAARAAYESAETQLGLAVAEFQRAVGAFRSAATQAEQPNSKQVAVAAISSAVGITALVLTGVGWVSLPGHNPENMARLNAIADKIGQERDASRHLLEEVEAKRAALTPVR